MKIILNDKNGVVLQTNKKYCKEDIEVNVDTTSLNVTPTTEEQIFSGLYDEVIVGAGLDISDVFDVEYCSWIEPDNLVPFRYPEVNDDNVPELYYKGKAEVALPNGQTRNAYYFKEFSNTPKLKQSYVSTIGSFADSINAQTVWEYLSRKIKNIIIQKGEINVF